MKKRVRKRLNDPTPEPAKKSNGHANGHDDDCPLANLPKGKNIISAGVTEDTCRPKNNALFATYKPEYIDQVAQMVLHGATMREIIVHFQVTSQTIEMWCCYYPDFAAALTITQQASLADQKVVRSLFEITQDRSVVREKVVVVEGKPEIVEYNERIGPSLGAIKFWLMNRIPATWGKDPDGGPGGGHQLPNQININMIRGMDSDQLRNTITLLQSIIMPHTGLKRLDHVADAETVTVEPDDAGST